MKGALRAVGLNELLGAKIHSFFSVISQKPTISFQFLHSLKSYKLGIM